MNVQVTKHSLSPAEGKSSCSPGALSPHPSRLGVSGAGHSETGSIQAASPRASSESAGVAGGRCRVKALMLTGVQHVVGSCTEVSAIEYLFGRSPILRLVPCTEWWLASNAQISRYFQEITVLKGWNLVSIQVPVVVDFSAVFLVLLHQWRALPLRKAPYGTLVRQEDSVWLLWVSAIFSKAIL